MKIVCDACSAKYSIADDKVKGKVFKIRCKKCSNIIVVRGQGPGAAGGGVADDAPPQGFDQKETRVYDYGADGEGGGDEAVWHVVVDQEQVGPVTAAEVGRKFQGGEIDADTFIWREGFADWQPLAQVDVFAALVAGGAGAARGGDDAVSSMFGGPAADEGGTVRSDPNDLFAAAAAPAASGGGHDDEDEGGGDIFGAGRAAASSQRRSGEMAAAGGAAADKKLRGERNENSVLFSLGNLAALASDAPRSSAAPSSSGGSGSMNAAAPAMGGGGGSAQHGGGEGSGLIDIRSMASAYLGDQKGATKSRPSVGSVDDLPVFSSASFSEPVVIMPTQRSGGSNNTLLYALIGVVGLLAVIAVVLVVVVLGGGKKNDAPAQVAINSGTGAASGAASGAVPGPGGADQASGGQVASGSSGSAAPSGSGGQVASGSAGGSSASSGSAAPAGSAATPPTPPPAPPPEKSHTSKSHSAKPDVVADKGHDKGHTAATIPDDKGAAKPAPGGKCMDEVGCLLAEHPPACCSQYKGGGGGGGTSKPKPDTGGGGGGAVDSSLPEELDRAAVSDGVGKVRGRINACGDKSNAKGEVKISVKVSPNGSVANVSVKNTPDPGLGSCVAGAMQGAHFSKTQKGGSFSYPFIFR